MKRKKVMTLCSMLLLASSTILFSSFTDASDASGGGTWFQVATKVDCSTSVIVYNYNSSTGTGSGSIGVSANDGTASGSASGSGSSSTTQSGAMGTLYTPMSSTSCDWAFTTSSCTAVACHATGTATYTAFK